MRISHYVFVQAFTVATFSTPAALASSAYTCNTFAVEGSGVNATALYSVNNKGDALGVIGSLGHNPPETFLRKADGTITYILAPDLSNVLPIGINNSGQIAVRAFAFNQSNGNGVDGNVYVYNTDGSYLNVPVPSASDYLSVDFTGFNDKGELAGAIYSSSNLNGSTSGSVLLFIENTAGDYRIIDKAGSGTDPSLIAGALNNNDVMIEHTLNTDGYLIDPAGLRVPLLFPGMLADFGSAFGPPATAGLNNNSVTAGNVRIQGVYNVPFLRLNGHFPVIVCPDNPTDAIIVQAINDANVAVGSTIGTLPFGMGEGQVGVIATPTGINPKAELSRGDWTFGIHPIGQSSGFGTISVTNAGPADLHIPAVYIGLTGEHTDHPESFQITQTNCATLPNGPTAPSSIAPGGSCSVQFQFTPQFSRWQTAGLYILSDSPDSPGFVSIGGTGVGSVLRLSNTSWDFSAHPVGQSSGDGKIYVYNEGPEPVTTTGFAITGTDASDFKLLATTCGSTLLAYRTCSLTFNFTPLSTGPHTATIDLNDNSQNGSIMIPISGDGN